MCIVTSKSGGCVAWANPDTARKIREKDNIDTVLPTAAQPQIQLIFPHDGLLMSYSPVKP
jgi:hypothetical protein